MTGDVRVYIPGPLRGYTQGRSELVLEDAATLTVGGLLERLDQRFPGIHFRMIDEAGRIREHIRLFVDGERAAHLDVKSGQELQIICAISGGREPAESPHRLHGQEGLQ